MDKIILIGGGGHCKSVIDIIEREGRFEIIGIIDKEDKVGQKILNYEIIGTDEDLEIVRKDIEYAFITIGQIKTAEPRKKVYKILKELKYKIPTIISPLAYVSKYSLIEEGTIVMHGAIINANVKIGKNSIINSRALVEHDCVIGNHCHISTGVILNGSVNVGDETFIGSGSVCVNNIAIPSKSFIKARSLVK